MPSEGSSLSRGKRMDELDMPSYASWIYQEGALSEPPLHKKKGSLPSDSALTFCILHFTSGFLIFLVYVLCLVVQSCPTLCDPMNCSLPAFSVGGDSPGKNTGVGCMPSFRGSSQPRDWTQVSRIAGRFFTIWATKETLLITSTIFIIMSILYRLFSHFPIIKFKDSFSTSPG